MKLTDAKVGMMVQSTHKNGHGFANRFIGTIKGVTVNSVGEAILSIEIIQRRPKHIAVDDIEKNGLVPAPYTHREFVQRIASIHPSVVEELTDVGHMMDNENG